MARQVCAFSQALPPVQEQLFYFLARGALNGRYEGV